jgi:hypothetical protein
MTMDNQHKLIKGYRDLSQAQIDLMNRIKECAASVETLLNSISYSGPGGPEGGDCVADARWYHIARTDLQRGFMALVRSVAKPESF